MGEKEWDRDGRNLLKFFVLSSLITEFPQFFWIFLGFFFFFWWDFWVFLSGLVMEEKGEKWERIFSLPVVMNQEIEFCIWGWVGICSNKSGEFCIWGYSIEGVGVSVLAEFVRGECSGRSSNGNNFKFFFFFGINLSRSIGEKMWHKISN